MTLIDNRKAIICLGAGRQQVPLLEKAKKMGFATIVFDINKNAPGLHYADVAFIQSTHAYDDVGGVINGLRDSYDILGVLNRSSGPPVITAARISEVIGLPSVSVNTAKKLLNKDRFRLFCKKAGFSVPFFTIVERLEAINIERLVFPVMVKPAFSLVGKSGIQCVRQADKLAVAVEYALASSVNGKVLIEEFVEGDDVSLLAVVKNRALVKIALVDEINRLDKDGILKPGAMVTPSKYSETAIEVKVIKLAERLAGLCKIDNTPFNLSCRIRCNGEPVIIELHLDICGDAIYDRLLPASCDFDGFDFMIRCLFMGKCDVNAKQSLPAAVVFYGKNRTTEVLTAESRASLDITISGLFDD